MKHDLTLLTVLLVAPLVTLRFGVPDRNATIRGEAGPSEIAVTTTARLAEGLAQGPIERVEAALELKFGEAGIRLMPGGLAVCGDRSNLSRSFQGSSSGKSDPF